MRITPNLTIPWTNHGASVRFTTGQSISFTWATQPEGIILAVGSGFLRARNSSALFACLASAQSGRLTVPGYITSVLPRDPAFIETASSVLALVYVPNPLGTSIPIAGMEAAVVHLNAAERTELFQ